MTAEKAGFFDFACAISYSFAYLDSANRTLPPIFVWNFFQWRIETMQVVNSWTSLTAKQISDFVANTTVIIVFDVTYRMKLTLVFKTMYD